MPNCHWRYKNRFCSMDSFYDAPRRPPAPPTVNRTARIPVVPEVSVVDSSFFDFHPKKHVRFRKENAPDLNGKTFKQIYMANVPDRHLDLSVFEPPRGPQGDALRSVENLPACHEVAKPNSDEPTIKDLFRIIQQQNEQIMQLQRQVNNLKSSLQQPEPALDGPGSPAKKGLLSIDFQKTSFEVSFRPPKFRNFEPKIQEICDDLRLEDSLRVQESYVSAVPSIQINMDEYQSSDEDEGSAANNAGYTFYKDLMDQVNNVLKKMQVQSECQKPIGPSLTAVKQATLQHLKSIGVNLSPIQEKIEVGGGGSECDVSDPSEVSFAVKQLLMKYLPDDKLTKAVNRQEAPLKEKKVKGQGSEFSFATIQYLKKYNLIDSSRKLPELQQKDSPKILDVTALKRQPKLL